MAELEVVLAGKPYKVRPLTLGQLEDLSIVAVIPASKDPEQDMRNFYRRVRGTVAAALSRDYPEMTPEKLRELEISRAELVNANNAVLKFSGLIPDGEQPPGEAAAGTASTGT